MNLDRFRLTFIVVTAIVMLLVASPAMSRLLVYPRTEYFTGMWLLDQNQMAENYPYNLTSGQNYTVYLGLGNQLGYCGYYVVEVKFRNETQSMPASLGPVENRTPSSLPSLFNISAFVADEQNWQTPLSFSFDYGVSLDNSQVMFHSLTFNNEVLSLEGLVTTWNATTGVYPGNLVFELWMYNKQATVLGYSGQFVDLQFNMTAV